MSGGMEQASRDARDAREHEAIVKAARALKVALEDAGIGHRGCFTLDRSGLAELNTILEGTGLALVHESDSLAFQRAHKYFVMHRWTFNGEEHEYKTAHTDYDNAHKIAKAMRDAFPFPDHDTRVHICAGKHG